jgi:hypothetical protein
VRNKRIPTTTRIEPKTPLIITELFPVGGIVGATASGVGEEFWAITESVGTTVGESVTAGEGEGEDVFGFGSASVGEITAFCPKLGKEVWDELLTVALTCVFEKS